MKEIESPSQKIEFVDVKEYASEAKLITGAKLLITKISGENLSKKGIYPTIIDARFAKPLDENLIWQIATDHKYLITIEEGSIGGFGSHVTSFLTEKNLLDSNIKIRTMTLPDQFIDQDTPIKMYKQAGLDANSIEQKVLNLLNSKIFIQKHN